MPSKPLTICRQPGCGKSCSGRYCELHAKANIDQHANRDRERERRAGGIRRMYDSSSWRNRTVPFVLSRDPMCRIAVLCGGQDPSTEADHVIRAERYIEMHGGDYRMFFDTKNLQGACKRDHSHKTALEQRGAWDQEQNRKRNLPLRQTEG